MLDDLAIRKHILAALPHLEPWRIEMEEIDFGEKIGLFYRSPSGIKRFALNAKGANEESLAKDFLHLMQDQPRVIEAKVSEIELVNAPNYEGRPGRHPLACVCSNCVRKRD